MIVRIVRQFDLGDAIIQVRRPLVRFAADKTVELVEALVRRPAVEGAGDAGLPRGGLVPLAERRGAVAVQAQHFRHRGRRVGDLAGGAREAGRHLGDESHVHGVMVAAGLERGARRRAQCRGMEVVVAQSVLVPRRSSVGVGIGPPKVSVAPKPRSSIRMMTTFGAPAGALTSKCGGIFAFRTSSSLYTGRFGSWTGSTVRSGVAVSGFVSAACDRGTVTRTAMQEYDDTDDLLATISFLFLPSLRPSFLL